MLMGAASYVAQGAVMSARSRVPLVHFILAAAVLLPPLAAALAAPPPGAALGTIVWSAQSSAASRSDGFQDVARGHAAGLREGAEHHRAQVFRHRRAQVERRLQWPRPPGRLRHRHGSRQVRQRLRGRRLARRRHGPHVTIKVCKSGARAWVRRYAGPSGSDEALGVAVDPSGTSYVTGESNGTSGKPRAVTIKYSSAGSLRWRRGFTGIVAGTQANAIAVSRVPGKAGVIIAGSMWNGMSEGGDILFVKYGATSGATKWWRRTSRRGCRRPRTCRSTSSRR